MAALQHIKAQLAELLTEIGGILMDAVAQLGGALSSSTVLMLAAQIASLHNIAFYLRLVGMAREHIAAGDFKPWKDAMVAKLTRRL